MPFITDGALKYFVFESLSEHGVRHGIFTRHGGVSSPPWDTLNTGLTVGDAAANVHENRRRVYNALGTEAGAVYDVWQVHSDRIVRAAAPRLDQEILQADGMVCDVPGITLMMRFADCVPVFLYDTRRKVIAAAHAGWKGAAQQIAAKAVEAMVAAFSCNPLDILACIGPSICAEHYEVGTELIGEFAGFNDEQRGEMFNWRDSRLHLDLWLANEIALREAGVGQIETCSICTACDVQDWFSHRAEHGKTGRFAAVIGL